MKLKSKPFVVNLDAHMLSKLVETVNASCSRAAMEEYMRGDFHAQMLIAGTLTKQCDESRRKLLKGVVAPHLDICCCSHTFASVLSNHPYISYTGCEMPEIDDSDDDYPEFVPVDEEIDDATFAKLKKLPAAALRQKLIDDYACSSVEYSQTHNEDEALQRRYYEAVLSRFKAAAQYAVSIGSDSARLWMEAVCLISPRVNLENSERIAAGLDLVPDCVAAAYGAAERAQRALWVDNELRKIPTAKFPRKAGKSRR